MYNFYPGPSFIWSQAAEWSKDAFSSGIVSRNHRSDLFMELYRQTVGLLRKKLDIPSQYSVYFTSSATECWEVIAESYAHLSFFHLYNGAFGEKWQSITSELGCVTSGHAYHHDHEPSLRHFKTNAGVICLTHVETSNGTVVKDSFLKKVKRFYPQSLVAIDATSGFAGEKINWKYGDLWFASMQKAMGLPSGMALLIVSPQAVKSVDKEGVLHYNSLAVMEENYQKWQTTHTPNILNIFLMKKMLETVDGFPFYTKIQLRQKRLYKELMKLGIQPLIKNPHCRSNTVLTFKLPKELCSELKGFAAARNVVIGNGYGQWKGNTFRVANFPAIPDEHFDYLIELLKEFLKDHGKKRE